MFYWVQVWRLARPVLPIPPAVPSSPLEQDTAAGSQTVGQQPDRDEDFNSPIPPTLPQKGSPTQTRLPFGKPTVFTPLSIRRPFRHMNTLNKTRDWRIQHKNKTVILGDSNLSRMSPFDMMDLQIDSYHGATFRHAEVILTKSKPSPLVQKLVLSFGINNKAQLPEKSSIKQLQGAVRAAGRACPNAQIFVPFINISSNLPQQERDHLSRLNEHITKHFLSIPKLPEELFDVERDNVHWSHQTARRLLVYIFKH
ncbi:uncharacterized protein LOC109615546 [Esox lucius]|uniref:uncharacterized protein LOC109615546 n=1 Tax=Esox lucius TaxID=8010 RepID=UPI0009733869|nr:uncharacterized protein LOC109615546 [Esox lucius]